MAENRNAAPPRNSATEQARTAPAKPSSRSASAKNSRLAAELLREIQIDGKALSRQIEQLRQRFA